MATQQILIQGVDSFSAEPAVGLSRSWSSAPIVVGLDGSDTVRGAAAMALCLARAWDAPLRVVSVLESRGDPWRKPAEWRRHAAREQERRDALARYAKSAVVEGVSCEIDITDGCAITRLAYCATSSRAELLVLGLRASIDRAPAFCHDTVLRLIRRTSVPVLAVTPDVRELPRRAIAAVDFSTCSLEAARAVLKVLQPGGTLVLAHLSPDFTSAPRAESIASSYSFATSLAFQRLAHDLMPPRCIRTETVQLEGTLVGGLAELSDRTNADVIAVGTGRRCLSTLSGAPHPAAALLHLRRRSILAVPALTRSIEGLRAGT